MQMDLIYAGKQRNNDYIIKGKLEGVRGEGCPQGGVLPPLLWSLVIDVLIWELNSCSYYTVRYVNDVTILIN
jgi:hypothetical protein